MATLKTVTQITSKTTGVSSNTYKTRIVTVALTDAADTSFDFTFTNNKIEPHSLILLTVFYAGTTGAPVARLVSQADGSCVIRVTNAGTAVLNATCSVNVLIDNSAN